MNDDSVPAGPAETAGVADGPSPTGGDSPEQRPVNRRFVSARVRAPFVTLLIGFLLGGFCVLGFHWNAGGAQLTVDSPREATPNGQAGPGVNSVVSSPSDEMSMTGESPELEPALAGALGQLLVWQDPEAGRRSLLAAARTWERTGTLSSVDSQTRTSRSRLVHEIVDALPADPPKMRLGEVVVALDDIGVRAMASPVRSSVEDAGERPDPHSGQAGDQVLDRAGGPDPQEREVFGIAAFRRWLSRFIVVERYDALNAVRDARQATRIRQLARAHLVYALEAGARSDIARYRAHLGFVARSLRRDFEDSSMNHRAQAALRWVESLPLDGLGRLGEYARVRSSAGQP